MEKLDKLVDFLQDHTGIAEFIMGYGYGDSDEYEDGEYGVIKNYLKNELLKDNTEKEIDELLDELIK